MKPHRLAPCIAATRRAWWKVIKGGRKWAGLARKRQCAAKPRYRGPSCIRYPVKAGRRTRLLPSVANANALGLKDNIYLAALMQWRIKWWEAGCGAGNDYEASSLETIKGQKFLRIVDANLKTWRVAPCAWGESVGQVLCQATRIQPRLRIQLETSTGHPLRSRARVESPRAYWDLPWNPGLTIRHVLQSNEQMPTCARRVANPYQRHGDWPARWAQGQWERQST